MKKVTFPVVDGFAYIQSFGPIATAQQAAFFRTNASWTRHGWRFVEKWSWLRRYMQLGILQLTRHSIPGEKGLSNCYATTLFPKA